MPPTRTIEDSVTLPSTFSIAFAPEDLILGGPDHRECFKDLLARARHRIIIHSTFIDHEKFNDWLPEIRTAARNGARIDVLWGESDDKGETNGTLKAVLALRGELVNEVGDIRIHSFSTGSHAKILIADTGRSDRFVGVLGSCNWLSSGYHSFEASVRLRDPRILQTLINQLVELSQGSSAFWTELTSDFLRLADHMRNMPIPSGSRSDATLVLGPQHKQFVREARDKAEHDIFVTSHRFSAGGRQAVIVPALAAAEQRGITSAVFYGTSSGKGGGKAVADNVFEGARLGVRITPVHNPRLHAKILAWDNDHVLITSQNFLSADPSDLNIRREIGIYVRGASLARLLKGRFDSALW
nr:phospholipase D-like domain-containing protein [Acetobacter indonesiensis]